MIPAPFDYVRADVRRRGASPLLAEHGDDAKLLAGGHSLLPMMKLRLAFPSVLIDVAGIADASLRAGRRRRGRDRRAHPAPRPGARPTSLRAEAPLLAARRRAGRRPAGAPPRHDRRLAGARRPRGRPARPRCSPPTRRSSLQGPGGRREIAGRPTSSAASSRPRWSRGRDARRGPGAAHRRRRLGLREVHPPRQRLGDRRGGHRRRPGRAGQHGPRAAAGDRDRGGPGGGARRSRTRPQLAAEGTAPAADMHADPDYRRTSPGCSPAAP